MKLRSKHVLLSIFIGAALGGMVVADASAQSSRSSKKSEKSEKSDESASDDTGDETQDK